MNKPIIDLDVDGVCGDILDESFVRGLIGDLIPDFSKDMLTAYDLGDIKARSPEAERRLRASFCDTEHLLSMPRYEGVENALRLMSEYASIVFHTLIFDEAAVPARAIWLEHLIHDAGIDGSCSVQIDVKRKLPLANADILIEDNTAAFDNSAAPLKIMILHPYNRHSVPDNTVPVENLMQAAGICTRFCKANRG